MGEFVLHERLAGDTLFVADLPLCRVLLMNDTHYPWLVLVPRVAEVREFVDLSAVDRGRLMDEICAVSDVMNYLFSPDKLNVGALGNMVPQLHVHVIARFTMDAAWPKPVWGVEPYAAYEPDAAAVLVERLRTALNELSFS